MAGADNRELISMRGLDEFRAGLRRIDAGLPRAVQQIGNRAAQMVVAKTRPRIPTGPGKGGHVKSTLKVAGTQSAVRVAYGSSAFPYAGWLDFGGAVGRRRSVKRPWMTEGRYVWKAYAELQHKVQQQLRAELADLASKSGVSMTGSG